MIARWLNRDYPKMDSYFFRVRAINVWNYLADKKNLDALYVVKFSKRNSKRVAKVALKNRVVSFVYDAKDLKCSFLIGTDLE